MVYQNILDRLNKSISVRYPQSFGFARRCAHLLNVTPNTIYNKLSGRTRFSVEELFVILHDLKIPVSELMDEFPNTQSHPMELLIQGDGISEKFSDMLDWYHETLSLASASENSRLLVMTNTIPEFSFMDLEWLSAFSFQKWLFYNNGLEAVMPLSQIRSEHSRLDKTIGCMECIRNLKAAEYILSINIMRNYILELIMFYEYRMITKEDAYNIFEELKHILQVFEKVCSEGVIAESGKNIEIYYYSTQMYATMHILGSDNINIGFVYSHYLNPIISKHSDTFELMKSWYTTWKRSSIPISMAGIKNRMDFINEQQKSLDYAEKVLGF